MKATIDVPDELYRRVSARSAMLGRTISEVTGDLYREWLGEMPESRAALSAEEWLDGWVLFGNSLLKDTLQERTSTEVVALDRTRLDRAP